MLAFLPAPILFIINLIELTIVTLIAAIPMLLIALFKWIPSKSVSNIINAINQTSFRIWIANNAFLMKLTNKIEWDIQGEISKVEGSCIIISNHLSWTDIVMLGHIYKGKIPITKFFLKHSLIYIPVIGLVCYAIGMPFLRRYTREQLLRNPKLKTKDLNTTRKACLSLLEQPSSLINFVEGTRYTPEKAQAQKSPYTNLMPPKAASLAVALGLIGKDIDCLYNTTILYPHTKGNIFLALLCGRLKKVIARVEKIELTDEWVGDYIGDKQFKHRFTLNLRQIWQRKDEQLTLIKRQEGLAPESEPEPESKTPVTNEPKNLVTKEPESPLTKAKESEPKEPVAAATHESESTATTYETPQSSAAKEESTKLEPAMASIQDASVQALSSTNAPTENSLKA